jgi:hypothetical protein
VVGEYKVALPASPGVPRDEWDAFTASLAWAGLYAGSSNPAGVRAIELHRSGSHGGKCFSVWRAIAAEIAFERGVSGPADCCVVAFTSETGQQAAAPDRAPDLGPSGVK